MNNPLYAVKIAFGIFVLLALVALIVGNFGRPVSDRRKRTAEAISLIGSAILALSVIWEYLHI